MLLLRSVIEYIAPLDCLVCGRESDVLCADCRASHIVAKRQTCFRCNRLTDKGKTCPSCRSSASLAGVHVAAHYDGAVKQLIHALKYEQVASAAGIGAGLLARQIDAAAYDIVTSVPTSASRYRSRGYNQAAMLGKALAKELNLPYKELLVRHRDVHQIGTNRQQRLAQVQGIFESIHARHTQSKRILIVDDVITTGATLNECAKVLKQAGAQRVWGAAVAKH